MHINRKLIIIIASGFVLVGIGFGIWYFVRSNNQVIEPPTIIEQNNGFNGSSTPGRLGESPSGNKLETDQFFQEAGDQIEYLGFADFYIKPGDKYNFKNNDYKLPLNVKADVLNYYDLSRRLPLDGAVASLNANGFAIVKADKEPTDFYNAYDTLLQNKVSPLLTSDFIFYYYQNKMKLIFKEIENKAFFGNLWDISSDLYEKSRVRYEGLLQANLASNDPALEGARQETAFLATTLEILKSQTDTTYTFNLPVYLQPDVKRELELIKAAVAKTKSPVRSYTFDYTTFKVPAEYKSDPQLTNFYLATVWLNSPFPNYYQGPACPQCTLDFEDWRISTVAASYLSRDLFNDPMLKYKWARIYKTLAYFKGLRSGTTLVNYRDTLNELFGEKTDLSTVFSNDNFIKLQQKINNYTFNDVSGARDPKHPELIGTQLLLDAYWPNDYLLSAFTNPNVTDYLGKKPAENNLSSCPKGSGSIRCQSLPLDIINLINPLPKTLALFAENSNYHNYDSQAVKLRSHLDYLNGNWRQNDYWATLATIKSYLQFDNNQLPPFARSRAWQTRVLNLGLAAWTNLQVGPDVFVFNAKRSTVDSFLNSAYVEPNLGLIDELIANAKMTSAMFTTLKLGTEANVAVIGINDLVARMEEIKQLELKELNNIELSVEDVQLIDQIIRENTVSSKSTKQLTLAGQGANLNISVGGIDILTLIRKQGNDLVLVAGPVFRYEEKR